MIKNALTVEDLTKVYLDSKTKKENKALSNLSFEVKQGEVFGLLGPNGAGKTTFLSILGGTVTKTSDAMQQRASPQSPCAILSIARPPQPRDR